MNKKQQHLINVINILDFSSEKIEIKEIRKKILIQYDNKPLLLKMKALCGINKRGKHFIREKQMSRYCINLLALKYEKYSQIYILKSA